jgi:2-keto-4-pentenoate hydratase/2-oxohepta-3-ene-1,7-dioic acid hydratase in catechol pathway
MDSISHRENGKPTPKRGRRKRIWLMSALLLCAALTTAAFQACAATVVKPEAWDAGRIQSELARQRLHPDPDIGDELRLEPGPQWMTSLDPARRLIFAGLRDAGITEGPASRYALLVAVDEARGELTLVPLDPGESPVVAAMDPRRRAALKELRDALRRNPDPERTISLGLDEVISERRLAPPIPAPGNMLLVAANFPSHLESDLAGDDAVDARSRMDDIRVRVFRKQPPHLPEGVSAETLEGYRGWIGAFDPIRFPSHIQLPGTDTAGETLVKEAAFDYEVELGIVLGRELAAADVVDDDAVWDAVAGYVLVSDAKMRNPQAFLNLARRDAAPGPSSAPYLSGDPDIDQVLGPWDAEICAWWGYAASLGDTAAVGPFFVAAEPGEGPPAQGLIAARSYAEKRRFAAPRGRATGVFYLRQCATATEDPRHPDAMIWTLPDALRSALAADSVLPLAQERRNLAPGDIVATGTPGGVVITSKAPGLVNFLRFMLSTWTPERWHDVLFEGNLDLYLQGGDRLFLWGEGLGFQLHDVEVDERAPGAGS